MAGRIRTANITAIAIPAAPEIGAIRQLGAKDHRERDRDTPGRSGLRMRAQRSTNGRFCGAGPGDPQRPSIGQIEESVMMTSIAKTGLHLIAGCSLALLIAAG